MARSGAMPSAARPARDRKYSAPPRKGVPEWHGRTAAEDACIFGVRTGGAAWGLLCAVAGALGGFASFSAACAA